MRKLLGLAIICSSIAAVTATGCNNSTAKGDFSGEYGTVIERQMHLDYQPTSFFPDPTTYAQLMLQSDEEITYDFSVAMTTAEYLSQTRISFKNVKSTRFEDDDTVYDRMAEDTVGVLPTFRVWAETTDGDIYGDTFACEYNGNIRAENNTVLGLEVANYLVDNKLNNFDIIFDVKFASEEISGTTYDIAYFSKVIIVDENKQSKEFVSC